MKISWTILALNFYYYAYIAEIVFYETGNNLDYTCAYFTLFRPIYLKQVDIPVLFTN